MKIIAGIIVSLALVIPAFGQDALTIYPNGDVKAVGRIMDQTGIVMPPGAILPYAGDTAPEGWLLCDGTQLSRATYADLFAVLGTSFGPGDGSTTFHLPDLRGMFLRGRDGGAERDPDDSLRAALVQGGAQGDRVGSYQTDSFQGHKHNYNTTKPMGGGGIVGLDYADDEGAAAATSSAIADSANGDPRFSSETRPVNVYLNFIIKT